MSTPKVHAVAADFLFDGTAVQRDAAVVIEGASIAAVVSKADLSTTVATYELADGAWLAPGFIDVQVNGGGDVLFNNAPTAEGIHAIVAAHRKFGTTALLPTLITDTPEKMRAALAVVDDLASSNSGVIGIHLEGPFISPERPGVHDPRFIRAPTAQDVAMLTAPRKGVTHVTLAPEQVPQGFIHQLTTAGIRVSLGHSVATYAETRAAMAEGLTGFTHLFNATRPLGSREPGPIAAALESPGSWFGMIVDGVHVDPAMLRLALRGLANPMLVTDAMPPVGGSRSSFRLYGEEITVEAGRCVRKDGTLAGAVLDMAGAVRNCVRMLDVPLETALRFASANPARFLGVDDRLGHIAPGCRADMVAVDPESVGVLQTWSTGKVADTEVRASDRDATSASQSLSSSSGEDA
jgi:N-acetylglucosamine-6-phosphate deacetylase